MPLDFNNLTLKESDPVPEEERQRLFSLSNERCPSCGKRMLIGEAEYQGFCDACDKSNEVNNG